MKIGYYIPGCMDKPLARIKTRYRAWVADMNYKAGGLTGWHHLAFRAACIGFAALVIWLRFRNT